MNSNKKKMIYINDVKRIEIEEFVKNAKLETNYQGVSFSGLCLLGCELVMDAYSKLTDTEKKTIIGVEELNSLIREKSKKNK